MPQHIRLTGTSIIVRLGSLCSPGSKGKAKVVTTSYISPAIQILDAAAKEGGSVVQKSDRSGSRCRLPALY